MRLRHLIFEMYLGRTVLEALYIFTALFYDRLTVTLLMYNVILKKVRQNAM